MNLPLLLSILTTLILSSQAAEDSPAPVTLEDNFILDTDHDEDENKAESEAGTRVTTTTASGGRT